MAKYAGFTLIELLVVMLIIGIITSMATLSVGRRDIQSVLEESGRQLQVLMNLASDEAMLTGRELALEIDQQGYRFYLFDEKDKHFKLMTAQEGHDSFTPRTWPTQIQVNLMIEGREATLDTFSLETGEDDERKEHPQIFFLSSSEHTQFTLILSHSQALVRYQLSAGSLGSIQFRQISQCPNPFRQSIAVA